MSLTRTSAGVTAGLCCLVVLASGWAPLAAAHNPAETVFHPAPVGDRHLVVGGEGTYAYLDGEGQAEGRGNLSGDGEVVSAPVTTGDQAAVVVRTSPDRVPHVQAFDEEGPTWRVAVGPAETVAYVFADEDGFTAFASDGRQTSLTSAGDLASEHELPAEPQARPAPAEEGYWLPTDDGIVRALEGEVVDERSYAGTPTDVTSTDEWVLVSLSHRERDGGTLMAYEPDLDRVFSRGLDGLQLGGQPAVLDDRIVVATYDPDGARVIALDDQNGSIAWETSLGEATAAAPALAGDRIVAATTEGTVALTTGGQRTWNASDDPYIASPGVLGDLVLLSSANNELVTLHTDGTVAWTWSDGVDSPPYPHHGGTDAASEDGDETDDPAPQATPTLGLLGLTVVGWTALRARRDD